MARRSSRSDVARSAVLAHIGANGPTSRAELARVLEVSPALITQHTRQLIADGLLTELTNSPSSGGRPAQLLGLVADAGRAIGVKLVEDHVALVEVSIDGRISRSATVPFDAAAGSAVTHLALLIRSFLDDGPDRPILGVGVGVPGNVDEEDIGTVDSTQLGWMRVPLGDVLRRELGVPVLVDNNVNALTVAEALYGQARGHDNVLVVTVGTGIGAGLIIDGHIVRGSRGGGGDLGHIPIVEGGRLCQCGARGCLEAVVGQEALLAHARDEGIVSQDAGFPALRSMADDGDEHARALFARAGHTLGRTLAGVVNFLDPERVIVLGEGVASWQHWSPGFETSFRQCLVPRTRKVPVLVETWQDDRWAQGAAGLVLATPFDTQGRSGEQGRLVRERLTLATPRDAETGAPS